MRALIVDLEPVWGYSIKKPTTSKAQPPVLLPSPTSLVGALTYGLGKLMLEGEIKVENNKIKSLAYYFFDIFPFVSTFITGTKTDDGFGIDWTDINRYQILQFQRAERRYTSEYRFGAVPVGKVYINGRLIAVYVIDEEKAMKKIGADYERKLLMAAHMINRIGSKESIVSVNQAKFAELEYTENRTFCTKLYHPQKAIKSVSPCTEKGETIADFFVETFWNEDGYEWGKTWNEVKFENYLIPAERAPLRSKWINFTAHDGYKVYYIKSDIKDAEGQGIAIQ